MVKMLFTVDEALAMKPILLSGDKLDASSDNTRKFLILAKLMAVVMVVVMLVRFVLAASIVAAMLFQDGSIIKTWTTGHAILLVIVYFIISCLPIIGNIFDLITPIIVIVIAFSIGNGISENFFPYLLPLIIIFAASALLVFAINFAINIITKKSLSDVYVKIVQIMETFEFQQVRPGKLMAIPKINGGNG